MNKLIFYPFFVVLFFGSSLAITITYGQPVGHKNPIIDLLTSESAPPVTTSASQLPDNDEEFVTVISYRTEGNTLTKINTALSYDAHGVLPGSTAIKQISTIDDTTGKTLAEYDGADNTDSTRNSYDGQGRLIAVQIKEIDLHKHWHITGQQIQYHLSAEDSYVKVSHITDSATKAFKTKQAKRWQETHLDNLGRKTYVTDSRHDRPTQQLLYNDLGQLKTKMDLLGNTETMAYDAQGQVVLDNKEITHRSNNGDNSIPVKQTLTQIKAIDYVNNTVTSWQHGVLGGGSSDETCPQTNSHENRCTAKQTQRFNNQQQLTQVDSTSAVTNFVSQRLYDNLGNKIQNNQGEASTANGTVSGLTSTFRYDALNNLANTVVKKRAGNINDRYAIHVTFNRDLNNTLVSKTINKQTPYRYQYDGQGNVLKETRFDMNHKGQGIEQTYIYQNDAYVVQRMAWTPIGKPTKQVAETDRYGNVDGRKTLLSKTFPDYRIDYTMDYNWGKLLTSQQIGSSSHDPDAITTYTYDPTSGQLRSQDNGQGQTINYTYYLASDMVMPDALKTRTINGITTTYQQDGMKTIANIGTNQLANLAKTQATSDALGEAWQVIRKDGKGVAIDNTVSTYDGYQRISKLQFSQNKDGDIGTINYGYKTNNQATPQLASQEEHTNTDSRVITTSYQYDNGNHLAYTEKTDNNPSAKVNFSKPTTPQATQRLHDVMGNLTDKQDPTSSMDPIHYTYDGYNQVATVNGKSVTWDMNGNMLTDETGATRKFDQENHEVQYQNVDKSITLSNQWVDGIRQTQSDGKTTFRYQYANGQLMDALVQTSDTQQGWQSIYATPTLRVIKDAGQGFLVQYLSAGKNGSVMYSRQKKIEASGKTLEKPDAYHYSADGNLLAKQNKTSLDITDVTRLFHGGLHDWLSGEDYRMARLLTTHKGGMRQFTSRDFGYKLVNLDEFANDNSVVYGDAGGHMFSLGGMESALGAAIQETRSAWAKEIAGGEFFAIDELVNLITEDNNAEALAENFVGGDPGLFSGLRTQRAEKQAIRERFIQQSGLTRDIDLVTNYVHAMNVQERESQVVAFNNLASKNSDEVEALMDSQQKNAAGRAGLEGVKQEGTYERSLITDANKKILDGLTDEQCRQLDTIRWGADNTEKLEARMMAFPGDAKRSSFVSQEFDRFSINNLIQAYANKLDDIAWPSIEAEQ